MSEKIYIFMNEQIKARAPKHGVITVQHGSSKQFTNEVDLKFGISAKLWIRQDEGITVSGRKMKVCYKPEGCDAVTTHDVKAWIEVT